MSFQKKLNRHVFGDGDGSEPVREATGAGPVRSLTEDVCAGPILYHGDPYTVDDAGYYCTVCGTTGDEDSRVAWKSGEGVAHKKGVGWYERAVIDAAVALARIPQDVDHRGEFESAEYVVWEAAVALLKARGE